MSIVRELPESAHPLNHFPDTDFERLFGEGWTKDKVNSLLREAGCFPDETTVAAAKCLITQYVGRLAHSGQIFE